MRRDARRHHHRHCEERKRRSNPAPQAAGLLRFARNDDEGISTSKSSGATFKMADENSESNERTQDPTPRRLEEALQRGDVVKSMEVNTWFAIAAGTLAMMIFAVPMASNLQATFRGLLARSYQIQTDGAGADGSDQNAAAGCRRSARRAAAHPLPGRARRQPRAASHRVHDRPDHAEVLADFAARRLRAAVLAPGAGEFCQGL